MKLNFHNDPQQDVEEIQEQENPERKHFDSLTGERFDCISCYVYSFLEDQEAIDLIKILKEENNINP